jgi:hypothetical protein
VAVKRWLLIAMLCAGTACAQNLWQQVSTPSGAIHIRDFAINTSNNHWFLADRVSGDWKSTDQGATWSPISSGLPRCTIGTVTTDICAWTIYYDARHAQLITTTCSACDHGGQPGVQFFRSSDEGASWAAIAIPAPIYTVSNLPANSEPLIDANGLMLFGGRWAAGNADCGTFYSIDGFQSTKPIAYTLLPTTTANGCGGAYGYRYNPITKDYWMGTEVEGVFRSTDGMNWVEASPVHCNYGTPCFSGFGNIQALTYDSAGNMFAGAADGLYKASGSNGNYTWVKTVNLGIPELFRDANGVLYMGETNNFKTDHVTAVLRSTDQGVTWSPWTSGIPAPADGNLEAWHFVYNPIDGKLYTNVQDQQDPAGAWGYVYVTTSPIVISGSKPNPPSTLVVTEQ